MDSTTTNAIMDRLAAATWDQLATLTPAALDLDEIARQAEIAPLLQPALLPVRSPH